MDKQNNRITRGDIDRIKDNPGSFQWAWWNDTKQIPPDLDPLEITRRSKVLFHRPGLVIVHNKVLKRPWIGYDENGFWKYGPVDRLHKDYVMCAVLGTDDNGYVAYRMHPEGSFILDEIFVSVDMPHSTGRYSGFSRESRQGIGKEYTDIPIEQRTPTISEFIRGFGNLPDNPLVFREGENLVVSDDEVDQLISGKGQPLFNAKLPDGYISSIKDGERLAKRFLEVFHIYLGELGVPYRR